MIVPDPENPKQALVEVIISEVVPPKVELILTESLIPEIPSVMPIHSDMNLLPEDYIEVVCTCKDGPISVMIDPKLKTASKRLRDAETKLQAQIKELDEKLKKQS